LGALLVFENFSPISHQILVVAITEQLAAVHNESVDKTMDRLCSYLPDSFNLYCKYLVDMYGAEVIQYLEAEETPG